MHHTLSPFRLPLAWEGALFGLFAAGLVLLTLAFGDCHTAPVHAPAAASATGCGGIHPTPQTGTAAAEAGLCILEQLGKNLAQCNGSFSCATDAVHIASAANACNVAIKDVADTFAAYRKAHDLETAP